MLVFRSLTIGLLGSCLVLLSGLDNELECEQVVIHHHLEDPSPPHPVETVTNEVTVIDVAPSVPATTVASLVRLHPGERITIISDRHAANDLEAGMYIADAMRRGDKLVDLTLSGDDGVRRVLVVLH